MATTTNLYRALRELLPEPPLQVATVVSINTTDATSAVQWPGSTDVQHVRGTSVPVAAHAFVRAGVIEGQAPGLTLETIEV